MLFRANIFKAVWFVHLFKIFVLNFCPGGCVHFYPTAFPYNHRDLNSWMGRTFIAMKQNFGKLFVPISLIGKWNFHSWWMVICSWEYLVLRKLGVLGFGKVKRKKLPLQQVQMEDALTCVKVILICVSCIELRWIWLNEGKVLHNNKNASSRTGRTVGWTKVFSRT